MPEFNEPWRIGAVESGREAIDDSKGNEITGWIEPEHARRINVCVNACAGIPTEQLEASGTIAVECQDEMQAELIKAWKQRDELLAMLERVIPHINPKVADKRMLENSPINDCFLNA